MAYGILLAMAKRSVPKICEYCDQSFLDFPGRSARFGSRTCLYAWMKSRPATERFIQNVTITPSGCWHWTASANFEVEKGNITTVARASWLLWRGTIEPKHIVSSQCGDKECVNPEHLIPRPCPGLVKPFEDRFWSKVKKGTAAECWPWIGSRKGGGYGRATDCEGKLRTAHRVSWEIHRGAIPDGFCVCHRCDNPPCVNPAHLFLGTVADNNHDRHGKGRSRNHEGPLKLSQEEAERIITRRANGETLGSIAADFNISASHVSKIAKRRYDYLQRII